MKRAAFLGSLILMACASSKGSDDVATPPTGTDDIIGGVDAKSASLNAVGAIMYKDPTTQTLQVLCSGTLISKDAVLTAKHCAVEFQSDPNAQVPDGGVPQVTEVHYIDSFAEMYFAIGFDSSKARMVRLKSVDLCTDYDGGTAGLGCDVSIYRTAETVEDVTPIAVASAPPGADLVGKPVTGIGFGTQNETQTQLGTRKAGSFTIRATTGAYLPTVFPTIDAFIEQLKKDEGAGWVNNVSDQLGPFYQNTLKEGYEVYVGGGGEAQACHGDSGGPILQKVDGKLVVLGVASTVAMGGTKLPCNMGTIYATLGPKAQELIKSNLAADPCEGIPVEGKCDGDVAVRCTRADEGARRVVKNDCAAVLGHCVAAQATDAGPGEVSCGD